MYNDRKEEIMDDLVIIDTETSGWDPQRHRVIEVAAVKVEGGEIIKEYNSLITSVRNIPPFITHLTGITEQELNTKGRDPFEVFTEIREFIGESTFVAHNVHFDYRFLDAEFRRYGITALDNPRMCTVQFARKSRLPLSDYKLTTIKEFLGIEKQSHRALNDVMVCYKLLQTYSPHP